MPLTSPGNDDDTGENHQPTLRKNTAEPVEQTLKQNILTFLSSKWALQKHNDAGDAVTVDGFDATVMTQYQKVYDQDIKTGKYYLHTNFYSKPDILKSELKAQNQQLVQGQITPDQYAKNIDAKVAAAQ